MKIQIAIDDFGVGYSNMNPLKHLAVGRVKIDRSLVIDIDKNGRDRATTAGSISMAQGLGLRVTAEGVEEDAQLDVLEAEHCDEIQGHLISRPMPVDQTGEYLRSLATTRSADD